MIVQDYVTHEVLTLAYMNRESLQISLTEGNTCFLAGIGNACGARVNQR